MFLLLANGGTNHIRNQSGWFRTPVCHSLLVGKSMKLKDFLMAPEFAIEGFVMWSLSSMHDKCNECMFQAYMHQSNTLNQTV